MDRRALVSTAAAGLTASLASSASLANALGFANFPAVPLEAEFVFEALVAISPAVELGSTPHGIRRYIPITGGTFRGPKIDGIVLPGGADWQTQRPDGVTEVDALYSIQTADHATIIVRNRGLLAGSYFKTVPQFEAPNGLYGWLNQSIFLSTVTRAPQPGEVSVRVFRVI